MAGGRSATAGIPPGAGGMAGGGFGTPAPPKTSGDGAAGASAPVVAASGGAICSVRLTTPPRPKLADRASTANRCKSASTLAPARTVRATALVEKQKEYIEAARVLALSRARILFRHLLPNCLPPLIVVATVQVAHAIALESTLSFLGLGLPITEPSLGLLISNGFTYLMSSKYWISFYPGLALLATIMSINLVADQLRDVLNPRLKK